MFDQFKRLVFLPVLVSNSYSMYGVLFLHWSVADIFFWFWCEFILSGLTTFVLMMFWLRVEKKLHRSLAKIAPFLFGFSFLYLLFFATLFAAMAYKGEWKSYDRFPLFLADKKIGLLATILSYVVLLARTLAQRDYGSGYSKRLALPFNRKCVALAGFYMLFLIHGWIREWTTGARTLNLSAEYLKGMGTTLLSLKLLAELGLFDHFGHHARSWRERLRQND